MARRPSRSYSPAFKVKMAVAAIKGEKSMIELAQEFDVHPAVTPDGCRDQRRPRFNGPLPAATPANGQTLLTVRSRGALAVQHMAVPAQDHMQAAIAELSMRLGGPTLHLTKFAVIRAPVPISRR